MMMQALRQAKADVVRNRVLDGAVAVLAAERPLTFREVAREADVPERTVYRHFPTRTALLAALFDWTNQQIGSTEELPASATEVVALMRRAFQVFDQLAPVVRQMLIEPDGLSARVANVVARRRSAVAVVRTEAPGLDRTTTTRVAAAMHVLTNAAVWQSLHEYWDMDGREAAETSALAIELLLDGARARAARPIP